jgi:hypothetical protein
VVTHPKVFDPPTLTATALQAVGDLLDMHGMRPLGEASDHYVVLRRQVSDGGVTGPKVHDARIAAICLAHGVGELWTADRDFSYFPSLRTRNPLIGHAGVVVAGSSPRQRRRRRPRGVAWKPACCRAAANG